MNMTGAIQEARESKSGKSLGVKLNGKWYSTKMWDLKDMVGEVITITDYSVQPYKDTEIHWINEYALGASEIAAPPPATSGMTIVPPIQGEQTLLLDFIGRCLSGHQHDPSGEVALRQRARTLYNIGKDILSGAIVETETGPRRGGIPGYQPARKPEPEPEPKPEEDFDDIPF